MVDESSEVKPLSFVAFLALESLAGKTAAIYEQARVAEAELRECGCVREADELPLQLLKLVAERSARDVVRIYRQYNVILEPTVICAMPHESRHLLYATGLPWWMMPDEPKYPQACVMCGRDRTTRSEIIQTMTVGVIRINFCCCNDCKIITWGFQANLDVFVVPRESLFDPANRPQPNPFDPAFTFTSSSPPIWEQIADTAKRLPESAIKDLPIDGASEHEHYTHGTPKRGDFRLVGAELDCPVGDDEEAAMVGGSAAVPPKVRTAYPFTHYVIYQNPTDYPGRFVVRVWRITPDGLIPDDDVFETSCLKDARAVVPAGLTCVAASPADDPVIVETWM
jgi:hypothetical protein